MGGVRGFGSEGAGVGLLSGAEVVSTDVASSIPASNALTFALRLGRLWGDEGDEEGI